VSEPARAWQVPTRGSAFWWHVRVAGHVLLRGLRQIVAGRAPRHVVSLGLADAPVVAEHRSALWNDARSDEFALVAGKVHNLRIAARAFDGLVVPAGEVLSFWRQLGRPSRGRGFVVGRELRAGCVVPTIAGGLCQLSNALATCAARAGVEIVERHGHTAPIAAATEDAPDRVDATVLWNYVDLRLRAPFDLRIDCALTAGELVLRIRAQRSPTPTSTPAPAPGPRPAAIRLHEARPAPPLPRGCGHCAEEACFRHGRGRELPATGRVALLLDDWRPEWAGWLADRHDADWFVPWVRRARRAAGHWCPPASAAQRRAVWPSLRRTWALRRVAGEGGSRQAVLQRARSHLAAGHGAALRPHHTHLVVDQGLLVGLWRSGALGGRHYEVLASSLPAFELQTRLDAAHRRWPHAASLADYRTDAADLRDEWAALQRADRIWTAHHELARCLRARGLTVELLEWHQPSATALPRVERPAREGPPLVVFPASALPRKGALELAAAMRELGWRLRVLGSPAADAALWAGIAVEPGRYSDGRWLAEADVVALPAHVEHNPRALLAALAAGLPVVATAACGLPPHPRLHEVPAGDVPALVEALQQAMPQR
jgi:glycosyltransferase involved in cell wall biosynthesis